MKLIDISDFIGVFVSSQVEAVDINEMQLLIYVDPVCCISCDLVWTLVQFEQWLVLCGRFIHHLCFQEEQWLVICHRWLWNSRTQDNWLLLYKQSTVGTVCCRMSHFPLALDLIFLACHPVSESFCCQNFYSVCI